MGDDCSKEHGHKKHGDWHKWKEAMHDENMPAAERVALLEEMKDHLAKKLEKIDGLLAELKK